MARNQVPLLGSPEPLATPAPVTGYYAPPPKPVIDNRAQQLMSALSSFNSSLGQLGAASALVNRKANAANDQAAANKLILGHTNDEFKGMVRNGQIPYYADPVANGAIAKHYATILGQDIHNNIATGIGSGQINLLDPNLDIDKLLTDQTKGALADISEKYPDANLGKYSTAGLAAVISPLRSQLIAQREAELTKQNLHERLGTTNSALDAIIQNAQPTDGADAQSKIRTAYGELRKTFDLPPQWIDQQLIGALGNNAKTHPEVVLHILTADRTDENGHKLPPLISNPNYAQESQKILATVNTALGAKWDADKNQQLTNEALKSLQSGDSAVLGGHDIAYTNPFTKKPMVAGWSDALKRATAIYQTHSDQQAQQRFESPDAQFERDFPVYHQANLPGPWQKVLEGVPAIVTNPAALTNSDERQKGIQAGELYMKLGAKDYNYLQSTTTLDQRAKDFYQTYEIARRYLAKNQDQALDMAAAVVNTPGGTTPGGVDRATVQKKLEQKIDSDFSSPDTHLYNPLSWVWHSAGAGNMGQIKRQVTEIARTVARVQGVKPEDAVTYAEQYVKDHSTIINGHAITAQGYMPAKELEKYVPQLLQQFVKQNGDYVGVHDASNLTITPSGNAGIYRIVDRTNPLERKLFVLDKNGHATPAIITSQMLKGVAINDAQATKAASDKEALDNFTSRPAKMQAAKDMMLLSQGGARSPEEQKRIDAITAKNREQFGNAIKFGLDHVFTGDLQAQAQANKDASDEAMRKAYGDLPNQIGHWFGKFYERVRTKNLHDQNPWP
jgi:hypothetical protein